MQSKSTNKHNSEKNSLGDRMKAYEKAEYLYVDGEYVLAKDKPFLARIDGHSFSKFTRGFQKPYDTFLSNAMIRTTEDLVEEFNARTGYTQSDEITLIFIPKQDGKTNEWRDWPFRGRVVKLSSLLAGYASTRFNYHLNQLLESWFDAKITQDKIDKIGQRVITKIRKCTAHFDARVFSLPDEMEVYNNIFWRATHDCARNSISGLARQTFSTKQLHGKSTLEMKQMMMDAGIDYEEMPAEYKYGIFVKKEQYMMSAIDQKTGKTVQVPRSRTINFTHKMTTPDNDPKFFKLLTAKYYVDQ